MGKDIKGDLIGIFVHIAVKNSFVGALSVVTLDGDPEEFIYMEPVTITSLQRALLAGRVDAYMIAKVLVRPLIEKAKKPPSIICFEGSWLLQRTLDFTVPHVVMAEVGSKYKSSYWEEFTLDSNGGEILNCWAPHEAVPHVKPILEAAQKAMAPIDIRDLFRQVREALTEIKKENPSIYSEFETLQKKDMKK